MGLESITAVVHGAVMLRRMPQTKSPKSGQKNVGVVVDQREFQDQRSATDCLTAMINDCKKVFKIPEDFLSKCSSSSSYMEAGEPAPLSLLSVGATSDYGAHVDSCIKGILKVSWFYLHVIKSLTKCFWPFKMFFIKV